MKWIGILMAVLLCLGFTNAWAEEQTFKSPLDQRVTFYGGAQFYQADGKFGYIKEGQPDIKVDLDDLGLADDEVSPIVGAIINLGRRWTLRLDYFGYHDDASATADFEFEFDDVIYPVGASLDSSLDLDLYVVNLSYNFIRTDRARLGVGVGVHLADIDIEISGKTNAGPIETDLGTGAAEVLAPLPNLYIMGAYAFTDKFLLRGGGGGMSLSYGDWDGSLFFANAFLEYWPWKNVGFGAGYRYLTANVEYDPGHKKETYDFDLPGPVFYVTAGF
jgi:hypothetical protein